jgi:hypothetical protein
MSLRIASMFAVIFALSAADLEATLIDSFDVGDQWLSVSYRPGRQFDSEDVAASAAIKGHRDVWLQWLSGSSIDAEVVTNASIGTGFYFSQGVGEAKATIVWDGEGVTNSIGNSLNADLEMAGADRFLLDISAVTDDGMTLTMKVYTDSGEPWKYSCPLTAQTGGSVPLLYSDFTRAGSNYSVSFSNVGAIVLELDGTGHSGSDVRIRKLETATPEPSTLGLAAIGTIALAFFGLRKRRRSIC